MNRAQDFHNALTLRGLLTRLTEMVAENERRGWDERNDLPVVVEVAQATTPERGTLRQTIYLPIEYGCQAEHRIAPGIRAITLRAAAGVAYAGGGGTVATIRISNPSR